MSLQAVLLILLLVLSLISDIRTYKIKNIITLPFTVAGLVVNCILYGTNGLKLSVIGWLVAVLMLFMLYALRMLGAGDVKLFGAVGAIMGYAFTVDSILYSFIFGGIIGVFYLIARKNAAKRLKYLLTYLKSCFLSFRLLDYSDFKDKGRGDSFRFSYAALPGTLLQLIITGFCRI